MSTETEAAVQEERLLRIMLADQEEVWLPVAGWEGLYEVSDQGDVRSLARTTSDGRRTNARILKASINSHGYRHVLLCDTPAHRRKVKVGRLVAESFIGPCPEGQELCHGPAGQENDSLANVTWDTRKKNCGPDKLRDGTLGRGERNGYAKLTEADVLEIYWLYDSERDLPRYSKGKGSGRGAACARTWTLKALADEYGVGLTTISEIVNGKRWAWLIKEEAGK